MYEAVELRLSKEEKFTRKVKRAPNEARVVTSRARRDWKTAWRVKRAKELLTTADEWSKWGLRLRALLMVLVPWGLVGFCVEINQCVGCKSHFSAMTRPSWLGRAVKKRHRHAVEQASRRWRGGRRDDSVRTRRKILISTQVGLIITAILDLAGVSVALNIFTKIGEGFSSAKKFFELAAASVAPIVAALAAYRAKIKTDEVAGKSRGQAFFDEAKHQDSIKDRLGFLARVKDEVSELFSFLRTLEDETGLSLIIVPFVDDLDRVMGGKGERVTKVLEAVSLILSIDNAPVVTFLAIDPRIVIHSIEDGFGAVIQDAKVTGWEYLDKIVQIPVAIPEPVPIKVERFISRTVVDSSDDKPETVAARLRNFAKTARVLAKNKGDVYSVVFDGSPGYRIDLEALREIIHSKVIVGGRTREAADLELVRHVASRLDPTKDKEQLIASIGEEGIEDTCRALNDMFRTMTFVAKDNDRDGRLDSDATPDAPTSPLERMDSKSTKSQQRTKTETDSVRTLRHSIKAEELFAPFFAATGTLDVSLAERYTLQAFAQETSGNPRRVKRVANVFQLAVAYAKRLAVTEADQTKVYDDPRWPLFACKLVKFIVLCCVDNNQ